MLPSALSHFFSILILLFSLGGRRVDGTNHSGHVVGGIAEIFMGFQFIDIHEPCGKTQGHVVGALHDAGGSGRG